MLIIGIITGDTDKLKKHEYIILKGICERDGLKPILINTHEPDIKKTKKDDNGKLLPAASLTYKLLPIQDKIESALFGKRFACNNSADTDTILRNVETLYTGKMPYESFPAEIQKRNIDIILNLNNQIKCGDISKYTRFGVWKIIYSDSVANRSDIPGIFEIIYNQPCCEVTVHCTSPDNNKLIIDKAWYNRHWSFKINQETMMNKSTALLFKHLDILSKHKKVIPQGIYPDYDKPPQYLTPGSYFKYIYKFYTGLLGIKINELLHKSREYYSWALFYSEGFYSDAALFEIIPVNIPKGEYWADPFLFKHDGVFYVFFENYIYKEKKGKISCGKIIQEDGKYAVTDVRDILDYNYHLSYPQIFQEDNEIYMIPETKQAKRVEVYRCTRFPDKWEMIATAFEGEQLVDTTYFRDENGNRWIFVNKEPFADTQLYIYQIDSLKFGKIIPHENNPVFTDCRKGRNGGAVFKHEGYYCRPSQINTHDIYGNGLSVNRIKKLTLDEFADEPVNIITPDYKNGMLGMHHLHQYNDCFIFDACFKSHTAIKRYRKKGEKTDV